MPKILPCIISNNATSIIRWFRYFVTKSFKKLWFVWLCNNLQEPVWNSVFLFFQFNIKNYEIYGSWPMWCQVMVYGTTTTWIPYANNVLAKYFAVLRPKRDIDLKWNISHMDTRTHTHLAHGTEPCRMKKTN